MENIIIRILLFIFLVKSLYLIKIFSVGKSYFFSASLLFGIFYSISVVIGTLIYYDINYSLRGLLIPIVSLYLIGLGILFANTLFKYKPYRETNNYLITYLKNYKYENTHKLLLSLIIFLIAISIYYFILAGGFPLIYALKQLFDNEALTPGLLNEARKSIYYRGAPNTGIKYFGQGFYKLAFMGILPIISITYYLFMKSKGKVFISTIVIAITIILQSMSGQRAPIVFYLTMLIIVMIYSKKHGKYGHFKYIFSKNIITFIIIIMLIFFIITILQAQRVTIIYADDYGLISAGFKNILERVVHSPATVSYTLIDEFPGNYQFRYGDTWKNDFIGIVFTRGYWEPFMIEAHWIITGGKWGYSAPETPVASLWVNFGWFGIFIGSIIIGMNLQFVHIYFTRRSKTPINCSFFAILSLHMAFWSFRSTVGPMVDLIIFILFYNLLNKISKNKVSNE